MRIPGTTLSPERKASSKVVQRIVRFFHHQAKPVLLGAISMDVGLSLARAQEAVDDLVDGGIVKALTNEEKLAANMSIRANAYVLVGKPNLTIALTWPGS